MAFIGNLLWFAFGGIWLGLSWVMVGSLCCCTIVGISWGCLFQHRTGELCAIGQEDGVEMKSLIFGAIQPDCGNPIANVFDYLFNPKKERK